MGLSDVFGDNGIVQYQVKNLAEMVYGEPIIILIFLTLNCNNNGSLITLLGPGVAF